MHRKEIGVRRQYPDAPDSGAVIAVALPVAVETRSAGAADEPAQNWQGVGEKRAAGLQLIVAALLVVVAERWKDRDGRKIPLQLLPKELHRLAHKHSIRRIRMVLRGGIEFLAEVGVRGNHRISARRPAWAAFPTCAAGQSGAASNYCPAHIGRGCGHWSCRALRSIVRARRRPTGRPVPDLPSGRNAHRTLRELVRQRPAPGAAGWLFAVPHRSRARAASTPHRRPLNSRAKRVRAGPRRKRRPSGRAA